MTLRPSGDYLAQTSLFWMESSRGRRHYIRSVRFSPRPTIAASCGRRFAAPPRASHANPPRPANRRAAREPREPTRVTELRPAIRYESHLSRWHPALMDGPQQLPHLSTPLQFATSLLQLPDQNVGPPQVPFLRRHESEYASRILPVDVCLT